MASDIAESCPGCSELRIGLFCERCGHCFAAASPSAPPPSWCAVIAPDRDYFEGSRTDSERFTFPASSPARSVALRGELARIGRRSGSRGTIPEIDLSDPPADPGVSREHARLLAQPDGTWAVIDDGSTNGTYVNGGSQRIPAHQQIALADGDHVHLGVWTTITVRRDSDHPRSAGSAG
ncbi:MAG: phosphopeptide-binding protein [Pseudonocardiales bacterium]|nr:FHA domain-containing protein [Actinomycetota bacterium]PZS23217.1 MAG: phosphopeptide-binding protein [Pseudonocardiales bacterium]